MDPVGLCARAGAVVPSAREGGHAQGDVTHARPSYRLVAAPRALAVPAPNAAITRFISLVHIAASRFSTAS